MNRNIRILLVDDHTLFRSGICSLLQKQEGFEVVGEAGDGLEGAKRAKALQPDVVLLDLHMRGTSGLEAVRLISEEVPTARVLMLTVSEDAEDLLEALRSGAAGYLLKNIETEVLVDAVRRTAAGEPIISPQMTSKLIQELRNPTRPVAVVPSEHDKLSPRERDILGYLTRGESNKEIARHLDLAESTVKIHVQSILKKLQCASRVQAAVYAVEHGFGAREGQS